MYRPPPPCVAIDQTARAANGLGVVLQDLAGAERFVDVFDREARRFLFHGTQRVRAKEHVVGFDQLTDVPKARLLVICIYRFDGSPSTVWDDGASLVLSRALT